MKKITSILAAVAIIAASITSCGKYEDGPKLSLRSKKARVAGEWTLEAYLEDGVDKTNDYRQFITNDVMTFEKDGAYSYSATVLSVPASESGTWEFNDEKDMIITTVNNQKDTIMLTRLKNKEMWSKETTGGHTYEYHLMAK